MVQVTLSAVHHVVRLCTCTQFDTKPLWSHITCHAIDRLCLIVKVMSQMSHETKVCHIGHKGEACCHSLPGWIKCQHYRAICLLMLPCYPIMATNRNNTSNHQFVWFEFIFCQISNVSGSAFGICVSRTVKVMKKDDS